MARKKSHFRLAFTPDENLGSTANEIGPGSFTWWKSVLSLQRKLPECRWPFRRVWHRLSGNKKTPPFRGGVRISRLNLVIYGLNRNFSLPRLAANFALRRTFCEGVSKARKRRTSSMIPSASSLFFSLFSALSIGSPFLTITSGIKILF
jgi:hypothetical protein